MERRKEMTKVLLCDSFKELMLHHSFDKITIKMITDGAGVIRPTFYNYFQDKYELLEWTFRENVMKTVDMLLVNNMAREAIKMIFICFDKEKQFYKKALQMEGQNSFEEILNRILYGLCYDIIKSYETDAVKKSGILSEEQIARFYSTGLVYTIKTWLLEEHGEVPVEKVYETYLFLVSHSILDIVDDKRIF